MFRENVRRNMSELISIIVPVFKVEKYLKRCVESIRNQTYPDIEIILVDDGSPDACPQICDQYAQEDTRIKVIHKSNGGLSDARNCGIDAARGKYIGFVDSDDYIHPEMYMQLWKNIKESMADIAVCGVEKVYSDDGPDFHQVQGDLKIYDGRQAIENIFDASLYLQSVVSWNKLYKKEIFENVRFPIGKIHEDEFTTYVLFYKCDKVVYNTGIYYYYYQRTDSIMGVRKMVFSSDGLEAYEQMMDFLEKKKEPYLLQLAKYRYLCLLKEYAVELRKVGEYKKSELLEEKYRNEYKKGIKTIKKIKRRMRLRAYRWMKINF